MSDLLRVYLDPTEIGGDGYPYAWHKGIVLARVGEGDEVRAPAIKDLVREQSGNRCARCRHPYAAGDGEWSPCDEHCAHDGPTRDLDGFDCDGIAHSMTLAQWRILTVHHLNGIKHDCRWWNLVALCQRCHLTIQGRVVMGRVWPWEHSDWFKPYAAGWYAWAYLGLDLSREETLDRRDELLALERQA